MDRLVSAFKQEPFSSTPDPDFLFWSPSHVAAVQTIMRGVHAQRGCVVLLGEAGVGKTLVLRSYLESVDPQRLTVIALAYPPRSFLDLLKTILHELQLECETDNTVEMTYRFYQKLLEEEKNGRAIVLLLDEAHKMPAETLATLLMFVRHATGQLLNIVLAGLPELKKTLTLPVLRVLQEHIAFYVTIKPLTVQESRDYVRHRLAKVAALEEQLFSRQALQQLVRHAKGVPRVLNTLCTNALLLGSMRQSLPVPAALVGEVLTAFEEKRPRRFTARGMVYAVGLLLGAGLLMGLPYGYPAFFHHGTAALTYFAPRLLSSTDGARPSQVADSVVPDRQPEVLPAPPIRSLPPQAQGTTWPQPAELVGQPVPEQLPPQALALASLELQPPLNVLKPEEEIQPSPVAVFSESVPESRGVRPLRMVFRALAAPVVLPRSDLALQPSGALAPLEQPLPIPASRPPSMPVRQEPVPVAVPLASEVQAVAAVPPVARPAPASSQHGTPALSEKPLQVVLETGGHQAIIRELFFTADGRELISVGDDKTVRIWSVAPNGRQASLRRTIRGPSGDGRQGMLAAATLSPPDATGQQRWLAVGGWLPGAGTENGAVRLHDYASGEVVALLRGHTDAVLALAFAPTGRWLASAGKDGSIRLWDLESLQGTQLIQAPLVLTAHTNAVYDLAWAATGERLASAGQDRTVSLWNTAPLAQGQAPLLLTRLSGHDDQVQTVAFHPRSGVLASGGRDQTIRLWQAADGKSLGVFARAKYKVAALTFSPDGQLLLAGNVSPPKPDEVTLFSYPAGKTRHVFTGHQNIVLATAFHPSGQWIASGGGEQKEILLWQAQTGEILTHIAGRGQTIYAVGFSQDGRYLSWGQTLQHASTNHQGPLEYRFDLEQLVGVAGSVPEAHMVRARERVGEIALHVEAGGAANYDYRLHVQRGAQRLSTLERGSADGHRHSAYTLTPDGQQVLSGGLNGMLRLYTVDGRVRATLLGHTGEIKAVAVSPDGRWAVSGANDQTVQLWSLAGLSDANNTEIRPTLSLFPTTDGAWVAWTPEGLFTASTQDTPLIGYLSPQGLDKIAQYLPAAELRTRFYQPGLIQARLHDERHKQFYNTARSSDGAQR